MFLNPRVKYTCSKSWLAKRWDTLLNNTNYVALKAISLYLRFFHYCIKYSVACYRVTAIARRNNLAVTNCDIRS